MDQCPGAVLINVFQRMENKMDNVTLENTARNSIEISQSDKKMGFLSVHSPNVLVNREKWKP